VPEESIEMRLMQTFIDSARSVTFLNLKEDNKEEFIRRVISRLNFMEKDDYKLYVSASAYSKSGDSEV
jgi:hypothetical protein